MHREPDFGGILGETFALFGDGIRYVVAYIAVVGGLGAIGMVLGLIEPSSQFLKVGGGVVVDGDTAIASGLFQLAVAIISTVASYFLLSKLLETRGRLEQGGTRIWAYVGLTFLWALSFVVGFVLLIVPGVILLVRWSASTGYLIGGREGGIDSFRKSWDATRGRSWPIFFAAVVIFLLAGVGGGIIGGMAGASGSLLAIGVVSAIVESIVNALSFCFAIAIYHLVSDETQSTTEVFE